MCSAIKRVYVPDALYGDVVDALAGYASTVKVGDGHDPTSKLGPINNAPQFERVKMLVADALSNGASAVTGGHAMDRPGYFFEPTILTGLAEGTRIVDEEQFGPALPVMSYSSIDDAVDLVLYAFEHGQSGDIFVQKAASATIDSITRRVARAVCGIDSARLNGFAKSP